MCVCCALYLLLLIQAAICSGGVVVSGAVVAAIVAVVVAVVVADALHVVVAFEDFPLSASSSNISSEITHTCPHPSNIIKMRT